MSAKAKKTTSASVGTDDMAQKWPALSVTLRPLASLVPNARNVKKHSEAQVTKLAASMKRFGWTMPVLVDEADVLIAGHGRVLAAEKLVVEDEAFANVPTARAIGWTKQQRQAYALLDNKLTENGEWDVAGLALELAELSDLGEDLTGLGFGEDEIGQILGTGADDDDLDDGLANEAKTYDVNGTMFQFGEYRLKVDAAQYEGWLNDLKREVGHEKGAILSEIARRLELP